MANISLVVGANKLDRIITDAELYLTEYRNDTGYLYQNYQMITSPDRVVPEDLAVTLLMNSQVGWRAFQTLYEHGHTIDLSHLTSKPLEQTSKEERKQVASIIAQMAQLPGFGSSVATKVLHKKRPYLIPVLDNQAIYGAYMYKLWPQKPARTDSIKDQTTICAALDWITYDLNRPENTVAWENLQALEPKHSRIQVFDSVWWMYFRKIQPVVQSKTVVGFEKSHERENRYDK